MNIAERIQQIRDEIALKEKQIESLHWIAERLPTLEKAPSLAGVFIDFDYPEREQVPAILQALAAGRWHKEPNSSDPSKIDYTNDTVRPGQIIRIYGAPPPPNCKIVEYDEIIPPQPERVEKRRKLVCPNHEEAKAAVEATAPEAAEAPAPAETTSP